MADSLTELRLCEIGDFWRGGYTGQAAQVSQAKGGPLG